MLCRKPHLCRADHSLREVLPTVSICVSTIYLKPKLPRPLTGCSAADSKMFDDGWISLTNITLQLSPIHRSLLISVPYNLFHRLSDLRPQRKVAHSKLLPTAVVNRMKRKMCLFLCLFPSNSITITKLQIKKFYDHLLLYIQLFNFLDFHKLTFHSVNTATGIKWQYF